MSPEEIKEQIADVKLKADLTEAGITWSEE